MKKFTILLLTLLTFQATCFALPNPEYLRQDALNSKIKEVAKVKSVKTDRRAGTLKFQTVTFITDDKTFKGKCVSQKRTLFHRRQIIGGLYFSPKKGELVYVTVKNDNGDITTYQPLSESEAEKFKANPQKIRYSIGKAYLED
ncbi:hypothetical protein IJ732_00140 [bacterium]|nr:hypothetical protein [bacterium]